MLLILLAGIIGLFNGLFFILVVFALNVIDIKYKFNLEQVIQYMIIFNCVTILLSQLNPLYYIIKLFKLYPELEHNNTQHIYIGNKTQTIANVIIINRNLVEILNKNEQSLYFNTLVQFNKINQLNSIIFYQGLIFSTIAAIYKIISHMINYPITIIKQLTPFKPFTLLIDIIYHLLAIIPHALSISAQALAVIKGLILNKYKLSYYRKLSLNELDLYIKMYSSINLICNTKSDKIINQHLIQSLEHLKKHCKN